MSRILIITNSMSGLFLFRYELISRILKENHTVYISSPISNHKSEFEKIGCKIIDTQLKRRSKNIFNDYNLYKKYKKIISFNKIDLVLTYTVKPNIYGNLAARKLNTDVISNITGLGTVIENGGLQSQLLIKLYRYAFRNTNKIFFQNQNNLETFKYHNITNNNYILIPGSGVNIEKFTFIEHSGKAVNFLFIGRIMKNKGIDEYLSAAENIKKQHPIATFSIIGSFEEDYANIIKELSKKGIINYVGNNLDVRTYLKDTDCLINPSYHEGMSNVLLEAAAMGRPLLASNIPGCKEIVSDGTNGFLFEPRNTESLIESIEKFIGLSCDERKKMGSASRRKIEIEFDRNIVINKYSEVIKDILGEN